MQRQDFIELFEIMAGLPVTIRLLDPPLHEFLPQTDAEIDEVADRSTPMPEDLRTRVAELQEFNPMLGHRGVRLGRFLSRNRRDAGPRHFRGRDRGRQTNRQAADSGNHGAAGRARKPNSTLCSERIVAVAEAVQKESGLQIDYLIGTMIELPRAALRAGDIAADRGVFLLRHQ